MDSCWEWQLGKGRHWLCVLFVAAADAGLDIIVEEAEEENLYSNVTQGSSKGKYSRPKTDRKKGRKVASSSNDDDHFPDHNQQPQSGYFLLFLFF